MKVEKSVINHFVEAWLGEFGRAIEMFGVEKAALRHVRADKVCVPSSESSLWLRQVITGTAGFETWLGAQEETWAKLGGALEAGTSEAARSTYLEIVNQTQLGAAAVTSSSLADPICCGDPETFAAADIDPAKFAIFDIEFEGAGVPALTFAVELSAELILDASISAAAPETARSNSQVAHSSSIYASVLELNLPVSVSVGRIELEISKVLQAGPGSVIGLNKEVGELTDLLVHGKVVARGEIVLAGGNYGFRVKEIASHEDRLSLCE